MISNWWDTYNAAAADASITLSETTSGWWGQTQTTTYDAIKRAADSANLNRNYVDQYWYASDSSQMMEAFEDIASQIVLTSKYYVTLTPNNQHDTEGYITITDQIGEFMEVKKITGIVIGDTLYSGAEMAHSLSNGELGTPQQPTDLGNEFVWTVQERMDIENVSDVQRLIDDAYNAGQLDSATGSNYIGWYEGASGEYLGHWNDSHTDADKPNGAKYINQSYLYLGDEGDSNMMHVVVKVSTNIENGHQMVTYQIPASLIPSITYTVSVDGDSLENASEVTLISDAATKVPMQLLFEVGLQDGINEVTVADIMATADHSHPNDDNDDGFVDSYSFYTNRWGMGHDGNLTDPNSHTVATAHFHPSQENEYYRFKEDETVLDASGNAVTVLDNTGNTQYYYYRMVVSTEGGNTTATNVLAKLSAKDLQHAQLIDGKYVIPAGTVNMPAGDVRMTKTDMDPTAAGIQHPTNTLDYYSYPYGDHNHETDDYNVYAYLGNNGTFKITPATGIRLSKTVTQAVDGASDTFTFTVTLSEAAPNASVTDEAGIVKTTGWSIDAENKVITVELKDGETVNIIGLPTGAAYTVAEEANNYYDVVIAPETGTIADKQLIVVDAENSPKTYGDLIIEKDVSHPFGGNLTDQIFEFTARITGLTQVQADAVSIPAGATKSFADQILTVSGITVADDASVTIGNIPHGAQYTVTETAKAGYTQDTAASQNTTGYILGNSSVTAQFINNYTPTGITPTITVGGTKTFNTNSNINSEFVFLLEEYDVESGTYSAVGSQKVTMTAKGKQDYTIDFAQTYTNIGAHYYRISEELGSQSGMIYDGSQGLFTVTVTDDNHDGVLEVKVTSGDNDVTISENSGAYHVDKDFTNIYSAEATYVDIIIDKQLTNDTGVEIPKNIFRFQLENIAPGSDEIYTVTTNADGHATIRVPVTAAGNKEYTLTELKGDLQSMDYNDTAYKVVISAVDNSGSLEASVSVDDGAATTGSTTVTFENTYALAEVALLIRAKKITDNLLTDGKNDFAFEDGAFKFWIQAADENYVPLPSEQLDNKKFIDEVHIFKFNTPGTDRVLTFDKVGTYRYIVTETADTLPGVTNDTSVYHVTVEVTADDANKTLVATQTITKVGVGTVSEIVFENTYTVTGEATLPISGTKTLNKRDLEAGEFYFLLKDGDGNTLQRAGVHANGSYAFEALKYTAADIGKTFTYQVVEEIPTDAVNDQKNGVTYDATVHTVTVKVVDNGEGGIALQNENGLVITAAEGLDFTNSYASVMEVPVALSGEKAITGDRTAWLEGETYTFELVDAEGKVIATDTVTKGDKIFSFTLPTYTYTDQTYNDLGRHYYTVREKDEGRPGVLYDGTVYNVEVSVTDFNGVLSAHVTVVKAGAGNVAQNALDFGNVYTIEGEKTLTLSGTKTITGDRDTLITRDIYSFELVAEDGTVLQTKQNNASGAFSFEALTFTKDDIARSPIKYTVVEADTSVAGVTKSDVVYNVEVTVSDNGDGTLKLDYTITDGTNQAAEDALDFVNTYTIEDEKELTLSGKKTLNGNKPMAAGDYEFELVDAAGTVLQTEANALGGEYAFEALKFDEEDVGKTFTYTVREKNTGLNDVTYDPMKYTVTVTISDNGDGKIKLDYTITNNTPNDQLNFTNSYSVVDDDELTLSGTKTITGDRTQLTARDIYSFELVDKATGNVLQTKQNDVTTGAYTFEKLTYNESHVGQTFTYTVREKDSTVPGVTKDGREYTVTVAVKDNLDGTIRLEVNYSGGATADTLNFQNTYTINDTKTLLLSGKKTMTGDRTALTEGEKYSFELYNETEGKVEQTRQNQENGAIIFDALSFTKADIGSPIKYTVKELDSTVAGVTKSNVVYTVEVTVSDNDDGTLKLDYTITDGTNPVENTKLDFENTYTINDTKTLLLSGKKTMTGDRTALTEGEKYSFELYNETEGKVEQTRQNQENGAIIFDALGFTKDDIGSPIKYTVKELDSTVAGVTKSNVIYTVVVNVSDNGDGKLKLDYTISDGTNSVENTKLDFANTYTISGTKSLTLSGEKTLENKTLHADDFAFELYNKDTNTIEQTVKNAADGTYSFAALTFDKDDIGEHNYIVREKDTDIAGVDYSDVEYTVWVKIYDNTDGTLGMNYTITKATANDTAADGLDFVNTYTATPATVIISGVKKMDGDRTQLAQQDVYTFQLVDKATDEVIDTATNDATGKFAFDTITYTYTNETVNDLGEYNYIIREVKGSLGGVEYDETEYDVKVTVTDLGGELKAVVEITNDGQAVGKDDVVYTNIYAVTSKALVLEGSKKLNGKALTDSAYNFSVLENGVEVTTGTNKGNKIVFEPITYAKPGTHSYTVVEKIPADAQKVENTYVKDGVIYDSTAYTVNVTVTDNGDGTMMVDAVYSKPIIFVNTYVAKDVAVSLQVSKTVENKSKETIGPEGFQFTLADENGKVLQTVLSDAKGKAQFLLNYSEAEVGKHTYTVQETNTRKSGVTYDKTTYKVVVNVTKDPVSGDLTAVCAVDGKEVASAELAFTNSYEKAITPPTGDDFNIVLVGSVMLLSVTALAVLLLGKKKVFGKQ